MTDQEIALYADLRVRTDPRIRIRTLGARYHLREDWWELRVETSDFIPAERVPHIRPDPTPFVRFTDHATAVYREFERKLRALGESAAKINRALGIEP